MKERRRARKDDNWHVWLSWTEFYNAMPNGSLQKHLQFLMERGLVIRNITSANATGSLFGSYLVPGDFMRRVQADIIDLRPPNEESDQEDEQSEISGDEGQEQEQDQEEQGRADNDDVEHEVTVPRRRVRVNLGEPVQVPLVRSTRSRINYRE